MKKIYNSCIIMAVLLLATAFTTEISAQADKRYYLNADWQLNYPLGHDFARKFSGWGAQAEGGYYITDMFSLGAFIAWHSNHKYQDRQTINLTNTSAITSDQQHSLFQLPFGASMRYTFSRDGMVEPYIGSQIGAKYSEASSYFNIVQVYDKSWGFFIGPEIGMTIYFSPEKKFGLHLATYYNYSTNKSDVLSYSIDGQQNWGVRVGAAF